jgi:hypothetical protein
MVPVEVSRGAAEEVLEAPQLLVERCLGERLEV